jgi:hypothetical protein
VRDAEHVMDSGRTLARCWHLSWLISFAMAGTGGVQRCAAQIVAHGNAIAAETTPSSSADPPPPRLDVLSDEQWAAVDVSIDRALVWLATQQAPDGSFMTRDSGQPAVTSLCVMAYLSAGHTPSEGLYGERLDSAVAYVLSCARSDGLLSLGDTTLPAEAWDEATHAATYNHAIAGLMLCEAYGQTDAERSKEIKIAVERALAYTRRLQERPKRYATDKGGWRYVKDVPVSSSGGGDADVSATAWHVMFLRSARNAGFPVPAEQTAEACEFIRNCYVPETGGFDYALYTNGRMPTRATTGAGVLTLLLSGQYDADVAQRSGRWLVEHEFRPYMNSLHPSDRYFYSAYYCSQAAFQLGGAHWRDFYPPLAAVLMENQSAEGSWDAEPIDVTFGNAYTTALSVLALTPPYQLLPIYQR